MQKIKLRHGQLDEQETHSMTERDDSTTSSIISHIPNQESPSTTLRTLKDDSPKEVSLKEDKFGSKVTCQLINNPLFEMEVDKNYDNPLFELNEEAILYSHNSENEHKTWTSMQFLSEMYGNKFGAKGQIVNYKRWQFRIGHHPSDKDQILNA